MSGEDHPRAVDSDHVERETGSRRQVAQEHAVSCEMMMRTLKQHADRPVAQIVRCALVNGAAFQARIRTSLCEDLAVHPDSGREATTELPRQVQ